MQACRHRKRWGLGIWEFFLLYTYTANSHTFFLLCALVQCLETHHVIGVWLEDTTGVCLLKCCVFSQRFFEDMQGVCMNVKTTAQYFGRGSKG